MFIEKAYLGNNAAWRVLITSLAVGGIFILNLLVFFLLPDNILEEVYETMPKEPSLWALIGMLIPFAILLMLLWFLVKFLHHRSVLSLTTSRPKFDRRRFMIGASTVAVITVLSVVLEYFSAPESMVWSFDFSKFIWFAIVAVILLPFQIGYEEYFFRGYLMQQIGVAAGNKWMPLFITSIFFGVAHAANPEIREMGIWLLVYYIETGFLLGIMTLMDEGLELALGYHFGNNLMACLLVGYDHAALQSETILRYTENPDPQEMLRNMLIGILISYPLILLFFSKIFGWKNAKEKLFGRVYRPVKTQEDELYS